MTSKASTASESDQVKTWLQEIKFALDREKDFRSEAARCQEIYEGSKQSENSYNILFANTDTLSPALYNSVPRPQTSRRFKDKDPIGKAAAQVIDRLLSFYTDDGEQEFDPFDTICRNGVLSALVPGRGVARLRYHAEFEDQQAEELEHSSGEDSGDPGEPLEDGAAVQKVAYETVYTEYVPWSQFCHGYGLTWHSVPWICYRHDMVKEELLENFGPLGAVVEVSEFVESGEESRQSDGFSKQERKGVKGAIVYEIWHRESRKVIFLSPGYIDGFLKVVDDPLGLQGFFDCARPLQFMQRVNSLIPRPLYMLYEEQAKELNRVSVRINKLISMLKVRGFYDSTVSGLEKLLQAEDGTLIPIDNVAAFYGSAGSGATLEKLFWLMPIDKIVAALQQLYQQRQQAKQIIYEITGIADIMRGTSMASETLGAQEIKNQWGTLRLKRAQGETARWIRDNLRLMAEVGVNKLDFKTIRAATGLNFPTQEEQAQAQMQLQQLQMQAAQPPMPGMPQQPAPQPPQELIDAATKPTWEAILSVLKSDLQRRFRIDIETNSTVDVDATDDKQSLAELLNAVSQFLSGIGPLVQGGQIPFEVAKSMLLVVVRRYRMGAEFEDLLQQSGAQQPQQNLAEIEKKLEELKKAEEQLAQDRMAFKEEALKTRLDLTFQEKELALNTAHEKRMLQSETQAAMKKISMASRALQSPGITG